MHDTRVVDENINLTQIGDGEGQEIVDIELVPHIRRHMANRAELLQILGCVHGGGVVDVGQDYACAIHQEALCYGIANTAGSAGDDCHLAF